MRVSMGTGTGYIRVSASASASAPASRVRACAIAPLTPPRCSSSSIVHDRPASLFPFSQTSKKATHSLAKNTFGSTRMGSAMRCQISFSHDIRCRYRYGCRYRNVRCECIASVNDVDYKPSIVHYPHPVTSHISTTPAEHPSDQRNSAPITIQHVHHCPTMPLDDYRHTSTLLAMPPRSRSYSSPSTHPPIHPSTHPPVHLVHPSIYTPPPNHP